MSDFFRALEVYIENASIIELAIIATILTGVIIHLLELMSKDMSGKDLSLDTKIFLGACIAVMAVPLLMIGYEFWH